MALPSNTSSSPSMIAGRTSPNSRNSEIGNPFRRSFSGNPFTKPSIVANPRSFNPVTPANSPSDYPRRNSVSRESIFTSRDNEEKENGKDQTPKPVRVRSPAVGKSTKHFMSPTISAASKIAVSPKKKILGDKNEPVRSSLSFSGMKSSSINSVNPKPEPATAVETDTNPEIVPISNSTVAAPTPKSSKTVRFADVEVISGSNDDSEPQVESVLTEEPRNGYVTNPEVAMIVETNTKPEIASISNSAIAAAPPKASKTVRFADFEVISVSNKSLESPAKNIFTEELDCVNLDPSFKISPVSSPMVAPLDADPLMPPYDPKTNYLSPRPQFLHYRPNRRIERYLSKEPDGSRFEDLFSSVNASESELSEETGSEYSQKESDEASSNESQKEEEEEEVEEEEEEEKELHVSEQCPIEVKKSTKSQFSRIFKISSLLLILAVACFSICVVIVHDPNILERPSLLTMEDPSEIYKFAKMNFNGLVEKLELWHANAISFVSDVVSNLRGSPPLLYLNQSDFFYKDANVEGQCLVSHQTLWEEENNLNNVMEAMEEREIGIEPIEREDQIEEEEDESLQEIDAMKERETDIEPVEREAQNEEEVEDSLQEMEAKANDPKDSEENDEASASASEESSLQEIETNDPEDTEEDDETSANSASAFEESSLQEIETSDPEDTEEDDETSANSASDQLDEEDAQEKETGENYEEVSSSAEFETLDQSEAEAATEKIEEDMNDSLQQSNTESQYQSPPASSPSAEFQSDVEENGGNIEVTGAATEHGISGDFTQNMAVMMMSALLLGLSLVIPAGLVYARRAGSKRSKPPMAAVKEQQPLLKEMKTNQTSQSPVEEEEAAVDDMAGESCSSEMSSFQYSSMRGEAGAANGSGEAHSRHNHGRRKTRKNSRRESLASSSLDEDSVSASPSYGSFTTYERIPIKHGSGEEDAMTPVRRSSRIRKQHTNNS